MHGAHLGMRHGSDTMQSLLPSDVPDGAVGACACVVSPVSTGDCTHACADTVSAYRGISSAYKVDAAPRSCLNAI